MSKILIFMAVLVMFVLGVGCMGTSTITEFDPTTGKIIKVTKTSESVAGAVTAATKEKTVVTWTDGWCSYLSLSTATLSDPTPTAKIFAGKNNSGWISAKPEQRGMEQIPAIIRATKSDLAVTTSGINSASSGENSIPPKP